MGSSAQQLRQPCPPACSIPGTSAASPHAASHPESAGDTATGRGVRSGIEQVNSAAAIRHTAENTTQNRGLYHLFPCLMLKASKGPICLTFFLSGNSIYWRLSPVTVQSQKLRFTENTFRLGMQAKSTLMEQHRLGTVREKAHPFQLEQIAMEISGRFVMGGKRLGSLNHVSRFLPTQ